MLRSVQLISSLIGALRTDHVACAVARHPSPTLCRPASWCLQDTRVNGTSAVVSGTVRGSASRAMQSWVSVYVQVEASPCVAPVVWFLPFDADEAA